MRFAHNIVALVGALVLMAVLAGAAFVLARSNPDVNAGIFFAAGGILYTMVILFVLHR